MPRAQAFTRFFAIAVIEPRMLGVDVSATYDFPHRGQWRKSRKNYPRGGGVSGLDDPIGEVSHQDKPFRT